MRTKENILALIEVLFVSAVWQDTKDGAIVSLFMGDKIEHGQTPDAALLVSSNGETQTFQLAMAGADETRTFATAEDALITFSDLYWEREDFINAFDGYGYAYDEFDYPDMPEKPIAWE